MSRSTISSSKWLLLGIIVLVAAAVAPLTADTWDLASQYTSGGNPNGNWSYGYSTFTGEPFVSYDFHLFDVPYLWGDYNGMEAWKSSTDFNAGLNVYGPDNPRVQRNNLTYQLDIYPPGKVSLSPYCRPDGWNLPADPPPGPGVTEKPVIVRWTAPAAGYYTFQGYLLNNMGAHITGCGMVKNATDVLLYNRALTGYSPNNTVPIAVVLNLGAGDTVDFFGRVPVFGWSVDWRYNSIVCDAQIKSGQWAVSGVVRDSGSQPLAGVLVQNLSGTESITTGTDGTYVLPILGGGTVNVKASLAGYEPVTASVTIDGASAVTHDFTLLQGVDIAGTVTDNNVPVHPGIAGASVATTDGVYSATTDSAGHYTMRVMRGNYNVQFYKLNYAPKTLLANATASSVTLDAALNQGWDFASDFVASNGNPNGPWGYGYATSSTGYTQTPNLYSPMNNLTGNWYTIPDDRVWGLDAPGFNQPGFFKNTTVRAIDTGNLGWYGLACYREPKKVVADPSGHANKFAIARFTAPTSGFYNVKATFSASSPYVVEPGPIYFNGTNANVGLMLNNNYVMPMSALSGFIGRSANGYADSQSTGTPIVTYSTAMDLSIGDKLDALVFNPVDYQDFGGYGYNGPGWTQVDVTISKNATTLTGRVTSTLPGSPPIVGATVIANGWVTGATYQTLTDASGYYVISARPDTYDLEARGPGFNTSPTTNTSVAQDAVVINNFVLTHSGTWNVANDFSPIANPSGQWSYGYLLGTAGPYPWKYAFVPLSTYGSILNTAGLMGWSANPPWNTGWTVWFAKNTGTQAVPKVANYYDCYVEPNHVSLGGGDFWYNGGPSVRWTAPDSRLISISLTVAGQARAGMNGDITIMKNGLVTAEKTTQGFVGTAAAGFTDSIAPGGIATYATTITVEPGDTLDFAMGHVPDWTYWQPVAGWPFLSHDLFLTIGPPPANTHQAASIADIKALSQGDTVIVTTPMQLGCATVGGYGFDKAWGNPTAGSGLCFYVQNADRTQGLKCITDGTVPTYDPTWKIAFTGVVDIQQGQKVVKIQSINSAVAGSGAKPIGKSGKSLAAANNGVLVKVWGKITQLVANNGADNDKWQYEYIVINDGSQDVKIPMHIQANYMAGDAGITSLAIGHMIAITGIAGTTTGSDLVVSPRNVNDIYDYTAMGRM